VIPVDIIRVLIDKICDWDVVAGENTEKLRL